MLKRERGAFGTMKSRLLTAVAIVTGVVLASCATERLVRVAQPVFAEQITDKPAFAAALRACVIQSGSAQSGGGLDDMRPGAMSSPVPITGRNSGIERNVGGAGLEPYRAGVSPLEARLGEDARLRDAITLCLAPKGFVVQRWQVDRVPASQLGQSPQK